MATKLQRVLRDIETLTPQEQRKVQEALDRLLRPTVDPDEEELVRTAAKRGIRITLPTEEISAEEYDRYEPIRILKGEPVSETVIKERR